MTIRSRRPLPPIFALLGLAFLAVVPARATESGAEAARASEERLKRDVFYLASDELEGRGPGTKGIDKAADAIAGEFKKAGLKPAGLGGTYFQPFPYPANVLDAPARLTLKGPKGQEVELKPAADFNPMGFGHAGKLTASVVFAGYGITSAEAMYDDYAGLDAADKIVVVLRGSPHPANEEVAGRLRASAPLSRKTANAEKHKAAAVLFVNDADAAKGGDDLLDFHFTAIRPPDCGIPVFHVLRSVLQTMLTADDAGDLADIERGIDHDAKPHGLELPGWTVGLEVKAHKGDITLRNIVGELDGAGPLAKETVVVGAHYDHLGYGGAGGSLAGVLKKPLIHHGADDNASGCAVVMELARRFVAVPNRQGRRLVFIAFSGEELGLEGSKWYCDHPLFPLEETAAMFNLDMVGRLRPDDKTGKDVVLVEGGPSGKGFNELLDSVGKKYDFELSRKADSLPANSDHFSFYKKKVPVLFFWTGYHGDYHKPTDTADKINVAGMREIADLSMDVVSALASEEKRPEYLTMKIGAMRPPSNSPRLGVVPSYREGGEEGLLLDGVVDDGPAARAGLKAGDRIVELGGKPVKNITTYMEAMATQKKGEFIDAVVVRDGKKQTIKVKLDP